MTTLLLARHGETVWHAENRYAGSSDVGLTAKGVAQAATLGAWAAGRAIGAVYASDLSRAVLTAMPSAKALGLEVQIDPRLREVHFGRGEGMTRAEMNEVFPTNVANFLASPGHVPLPEGEAGLAAVERAWTSLEEISARHHGGTVLVVMHSTLMRLLLCRVLGVPLDNYRDTLPCVLNAAITSITIDQNRPALHSYNVPTSLRGEGAHR